MKSSSLPINLSVESRSPRVASRLVRRVRGLLSSRIAIAFLLSVTVAECFAQWKPGEDLAGTRQIANYRGGVGRLEWTFPAELHAIFAVPHWTAGPRVGCGSDKPGQEIECEVEVAPRDVSISLEQRQRQLLSEVGPLIAHSKDKNVGIRTHVGDVIYVVLEHADAVGQNRHIAVGYAHRSTALLKFEARYGSHTALGTFLELVGNVKAIDALSMWAWRLGDYRVTCAQRYPELKEMNDRVFAASPFGSVDVHAFFLQRNQSSTTEKVKVMLDEGLRGFGEDFDRNPEHKKRAFCEGFPSWIAEASKGL